ncbi:MAG TPA: penicillin-binding protein 2 [Gemmatimonadales bacterium]|nr:penicillin-binding protein 2 [Gemmatimonadales bacterium]HRZ08803.1 penicillin-binding protein 2 [Gemmatimonadales bacterium]
MNEFHSYRRAERAGIARWFFVATFLVLVVAFFRTQVVQHERFRVRAEKNRLRIVPLVAPRGIIYDRNGLIIAENVPGYAIKLLAPSQDSLHAVLARFREVVPLDTSEVGGIMSRYRQAPYQPVLVVGNGTFEMVSRLEEHRAVLPGLVIQSEPRRYYPDGPAVAHLVGYVGEVSERDLESDRFPGAQLGTVVGRAGLEQEYDKELRGRPGVHYVEVNARGRLVREENVAPALAAIPGEAIRTTIDLTLQRYIDSLWQAAAPGVRGSMVALTPTGEVLALYSAPGYDPNAFVGGISTEEWRRLNDDPARPLLDRAIQTRYPPASPFKLATAAMALKRGIATFTTHMPEPCRGGLQVGNRYFRCWKPEGHGSLDLEGAIAKSCDVYFYQLGLRIGLDAILSDGVLMGFRERSGIDLENEIAPIYPSNAAYFDRKYGPRGWSKWGATLNFSIGQGENTQNVINMTRFYAALASGGEAPTPYIVRPRSDQVRDLGLTPEQLMGLRTALIAVVERGTAAASRSIDLSIAGKTGTAQNSHGEDHGWYVGFAPAEKPQIIVGSIMEFAEHGSNVAPFVNRVLHRYVAGPGIPAAPSVIALPADSAPRSMQIVPDSTPQVDPVADDTVLPPPPAPSGP